MRNGSIPANWLDLIEQSEHIKYEDGNELSKLWACNEYNIDEFQNIDELSDDTSASDQTPVTNNLSSTSVFSKESNLLMPTMPILNESTSRRSGRARMKPDFYDPSAVSTIKSDPSKTKCGLFTMICLVTVSTLPSPSMRTSMIQSNVYHTQQLNEHFDGTLNYLNPFGLMTSSDNDTYTFKDIFSRRTEQSLSRQCKLKFKIMKTGVIGICLIDP